MTDQPTAPTPEQFMAADHRGKIQMLITELRKERWPDMHWDFKHYLLNRATHGDIVDPREFGGCGSVGCAMGLADLRWSPRTVDTPEVYTEEASNKLIRAVDMVSDDMTGNTSNDVFFGGYHYSVPHRDVTPVMVADALQRVLDAGSTKP